MYEARVCLAIRWGRPPSSTAPLGCVFLRIANAAARPTTTAKPTQARVPVLLKKELRHAAEFAEALEAALGGERAVLLHHRAHLQVLLQHLIHLLHGGPAAAGDAFAP